MPLCVFLYAHVPWIQVTLLIRYCYLGAIKFKKEISQGRESTTYGYLYCIFETSMGQNTNNMTYVSIQATSTVLQDPVQVDQVLIFLEDRHETWHDLKMDLIGHVFARKSIFSLSDHEFWRIWPDMKIPDCGPEKNTWLEDMLTSALDRCVDLIYYRNISKTVCGIFSKYL